MFDSIFDSSNSATGSKTGEAGITEDLVANAQRGDQAAFNELFSRLTSRLLFFVRSRMGPKLRITYDPWDVLQETYLSAYQSLEQFQGRGAGSFTSWIFRIAEHRICNFNDHITRKKRQGEHADARGTAILQQLRDSGPSPVTECANEDVIEKLIEAIDTLSEAERKVLFARYFHLETLTDIANTLEKSESGIRAILARIHIKLGRIMAKFQS